VQGEILDIVRRRWKSDVHALDINCMEIDEVTAD